MSGAHEQSPRALGEGAAREAPTAPHATDPQPQTRRPANGPERFWARTPVRLALAVALVLSVAAHGAVLPLEPPASFQMRDVEGEAAIPIDLLAPEPPAPPAAEPEAEEPSQPPSPSNAAEPAFLTARDAGPSDGGVRDASRDAPSDGPSDAVADALADALADARPDGPLAAGDAASIATAGDAGDGAGPLAIEDGGPRDPHVLVGAAASVQPKVVNVVLVISSQVIRENPVGATLGTLLRGIPQWHDFMQGTNIDPVRDTTWFMVSGASLVNTERDVVLLRYDAPDAVVDHAIAILGRRYPRGGPMDLGVPGAHAVLAHADRAERAIVRPGPHLVAIVPPAEAKTVARQLVGARVQPPLGPGEAVYLRFVHPQGPFPEMPEAIREMRLRVVPRKDAGADVYFEGDAPDAAAAAVAAEGLARVIRRHDDLLTSLVTHGLLDRVEVRAEGPMVKGHLAATRDQIEAVASLVGALLGVSPPEGPTRDPAGAGPRSEPGLAPRVPARP